MVLHRVRYLHILQDFIGESDNENDLKFDDANLFILFATLMLFGLINNDWDYRQAAK